MEQGDQMPGQTSLGHPAVDAFMVTATYAWPSGWSCRVSTRRSGQRWEDSLHDDYHDLTTDELVDVVTAHVDGLRY